jgi:hypothetical protein
VRWVGLCVDSGIASDEFTVYLFHASYMYNKLKAMQELCIMCLYLCRDPEPIQSFRE